MATKITPDFHVTAAQMLDGESDRGCVLVGASLLDEALTDGLRRRLSLSAHAVKHAVDPLFRAMGPLSTLSAKIKTAYALGLVTESMFRDLERTRELRNAFAHKQHPVDMLDVAIKAEIALLTTGTAEIDQLQRYDVKSTAGRRPSASEIAAKGFVKAPKARFTMCIYKLIAHLEAGAT